MKNTQTKVGRLGIALMLVFGLFLPSCKKEIYPSLQKDLFSYQGPNPVVKDVVAELKKPQYSELRGRLGQHGPIKWDEPKMLLTTSFMDGLSLRFYSADSNYFDARINAQTKAMQLLDRAQLRIEEDQTNARMQQASLARAKQMGRKASSSTDPDWPLCNQPNVAGLCQQTINAELVIWTDYGAFNNNDAAFYYILTELFYGSFFNELSKALRKRGYDRYVDSSTWINPSEVKTRQDIIFDLWDAHSEAIFRWNRFNLPQSALPKMQISWIEPGSTCCPVPERPVGGSGSIPDPLSAQSRLAVEELIAENAAEDAFLANNPICYGTGRTGNVKFQGTAEHWLIQFDYVTTVAGGVREYSIPMAGSSGIRAGYADIANTITGDMFEIKSEKTGPGAAFSDITNYVRLAGGHCPPPSSGTWRLGTGYTTRYLKYPGELGSVLKAWSPAPGVILYNKISANDSPIPVPVLLPENLAQRLKDFVRSLVRSPVGLEGRIAAFLEQNPNIAQYIRVASVALMIATIIEDIVTGGLGVADDYISFTIARTMWRLAGKIY